MKSSVKKIPIVYYHSIGPVMQGWNRNYLTIETKNFEQHLKYFKNNYSVISLSEYYNIRSGLMKSPKNPLVITVDDGYLDNWIWAFPLLKKYNVCATIFVNPEMVDTRNCVRKKSDDYKDINAGNVELNKAGFMSWEELILMEKSGLVDIQSHTSSHTKYFVSNTITGFHHPGGDCLYPIGNTFPDRKPFHILNKEFENLLPYGTPFFEEQSSVIAKRVIINPEFNKACVEALKEFDFSDYRFQAAYKKVKPIYDSFMKSNSVIIKRETDEEYQLRLEYEIIQSKKTIENRMGKKVDFLSWPHGDNSQEVHELAIKNGYKATTIGKLRTDSDSVDRIGQRFGFRPYFKSAKFGFIKLNTKIKDLEGNSSASLIRKMYQAIKIRKK